ncbi:IS1 family transposase, partial [[Clostridium] innocuum]
SSCKYVSYLHSYPLFTIYTSFAIFPSQQIKGFYVGSRGTASLEKFLQKISHLDVKTYATDAWKAYNLIDPKKHITGKAHTYTVERTNRLLRHYLARFARKTYSISKSFDMILYSLYLFCFRQYLSSIFF